MSNKLTRRGFLKMAAVSAARLAAAGILGNAPFAAQAESGKAPACEGEKKPMKAGIIGMVTEDAASPGINERRIQPFESTGKGGTYHIVQEHTGTVLFSLTP